jgi:cystathionine beta-lyase
MKYDFTFFDQPLSPSPRDSIKWCQFPKDIIPLWIADMDFRACEEITTALVQRAQTGHYAYAVESEGAIQAMIDYHREHYNIAIERDWVVPMPGIVCALNLFCRMLREKRPEANDLFIGEPVYHHFMESAAIHGVRERKIELAMQGASLPPLETLDAKGAGAWMFCNPANPLGYLWNATELREVLDFCMAHHLLLVSDEIHGGIVLDAPHTYTPLLSLTQNEAERNAVITFVAPSKTWNVPGLGCAFAIIPNPEIRQWFRAAYGQIVPDVNLFGWVGAEAAYRYGESWRLGMLAYLRRNRDLLERTAAQWGLPLCRLNATYLAFMDCTTLLPLLGAETPAQFFLRHGVALHDGAIFGKPGWVRINLATQTALLSQAFERMGNALATLTH